MEMARSAIVETLAPTSGRQTHWTIGAAVVNAALLEVSTHPKPGLVTPLSNGSHADMDLQTFMVSTAAIAPGFYLCAECGMDHRGTPKALLPKIRDIGREYEQRLLSATGGVNTQRGLLFSGGILCGAAGFLSRYPYPLSAERLFATVADMTEGLCARELRGRNGRAAMTAGETLFDRFGTLGIPGRGRSRISDRPRRRPAGSGGSPGGRRVAQPRLVHTLISLMAVTEDSTLLWRGGAAALGFVRTRSRAILARGGALSDAGWSEIENFDAECIARNISPGGSADLLAVTLAVQALVDGNTAFIDPESVRRRGGQEPSQCERNP